MSANAGARVPLYRFAGPRYWPAWLLLGWMRLTAMLPWPWPLTIHKPIGALFGRLLGKQRRIVKRNLEICLPSLDTERLTDEFFQNLGFVLAEMSVAWFSSRKRLSRLIDVEGLEHLTAALADGKGAILLTGHFTTLEIASRAIQGRIPRFAFMFTRRRNPLFDEIQRRARARAADDFFASDDVRSMLRSLAANAAVWYAPDQAAGGRLGGATALVPFFGEPAVTSTATSRLAKISGAAVVPMMLARKADASGYLVRFYPALENFPSEDAVEDTRRAIEVIESFILERPAQYLWNHRRFKGRPPPYPDVYAREK